MKSDQWSVITDKKIYINDYNLPIRLCIYPWLVQQYEMLVLKIHLQIEINYHEMYKQEDHELVVQELIVCGQYSLDINVPSIGPLDLRHHNYSEIIKEKKHKIKFIFWNNRKFFVVFEFLNLFVSSSSVFVVVFLCFCLTLRIGRLSLWKN